MHIRDGIAANHHSRSATASSTRSQAASWPSSARWRPPAPSTRTSQGEASIIAAASESAGIIGEPRC